MEGKVQIFTTPAPGLCLHHQPFLRTSTFATSTIASSTFYRKRLMMQFGTSKVDDFNPTRYPQPKTKG